jgi:hypothetical protein
MNEQPLPSQLQYHLNLMQRWRRWGERLVFIPLAVIAGVVILGMMKISVLDLEEHWAGTYVVDAVYLLMWAVFLVGVIAAVQLFITAKIAFGVPRALGYFILTTIFAAVPGYFLLRYYLLAGGMLAIPLWFGLFLVPSLLKEEIRRRSLPEDRTLG